VANVRIPPSPPISVEPHQNVTTDANEMGEGTVRRLITYSIRLPMDHYTTIWLCRVPRTYDKAPYRLWRTHGIAMGHSWNKGCMLLTSISSRPTNATHLSTRSQRADKTLHRMMAFISSQGLSSGGGTDAVNRASELASNLMSDGRRADIILLTARGQLLSSALRPLSLCKTARPLRRAFAT